MPYIRPEVRHVLAGGDHDPLTPGELSYVITLEILAYIDRMPRGYQALNDVLGALEGAKLEFYRRVVAPFEVGKAVVNGDVYE